MNKLRKLLIAFILFQIIAISKNIAIILQESTPMLTFTTPPIGSNAGLRYIIMDNTDNNIVYYCF